MINKPKFLLTVADTNQFQNLFRGPFLQGYREPRIAIVGRSNVGKSSLINALLEVQLARTSSQPGKTRAIHFYLWPKAKKIIADLPGYGYAQVSKSEKLRWENFIDLYFQHDPQLERVLMMIDARHGPTSSDIEAIRFLNFRRIPATLIIAKIDTLKTQAQRSSRKEELRNALENLNIQLEDTFWVSTHQGTGIKALKQELHGEFHGVKKNHL